jgi:hypothetical protein
VSEQRVQPVVFHIDYQTLVNRPCLKESGEKSIEKKATLAGITVDQKIQLAQGPALYSIDNAHIPIYYVLDNGPAASPRQSRNTNAIHMKALATLTPNVGSMGVDDQSVGVLQEQRASCLASHVSMSPPRAAANDDHQKSQTKKQIDAS